MVYTIGLECSKWFTASTKPTSSREGEGLQSGFMKLGINPVRIWYIMFNPF